MSERALSEPAVSEPGGVPVPVDGVRVGDAERQRAAMVLGDHFAAGRLDQQEYDDRVRAAYGARTRDDLRSLFGDLPGPAPVETERPVGTERPVAAGRRRPACRIPPPVIVLLLVASFVVSAVAHVPVFPIVALLLIVGRVRRRPAYRS